MFQAVNSIVSIVSGTRRLAWAHLDRKLAVLDWQQTEYCQLMKGSYLSSVYLEEVRQLHLQILTCWSSSSFSPKRDEIVKDGFSLGTYYSPVPIVFSITYVFLIKMLCCVFNAACSLSLDAVGGPLIAVASVAELRVQVLEFP